MRADGEDVPTPYNVRKKKDYVVVRSYPEHGFEVRAWFYTDACGGMRSIGHYILDQALYDAYILRRHKELLKDFE